MEQGMTGSQSSHKGIARSFVQAVGRSVGEFEL
jgi:hypothetical protein